MEDLTEAADLFHPVYDQACSVDGRRSNLLKILGTKEGLPAIEEAIFAEIPVNVVLLFSDDQYLRLLTHSGTASNAELPQD